MSTYEAWRAEYQDAEQAARAAYKTVCEQQEQLAAIGAGGVEPLRKTSATDSAAQKLRCHPVRVRELEECRVLNLETIDRLNAYIKALESQLDHFRGVTKMVPTFTTNAQNKLDTLLAQGWRVTGYAIERDDGKWAPQRGFVTHGGLVGWWTPPQIDRIPGAQHGQPT